MGLQSKTLIYIGGNPIDSFKEFTLDQSIAKHHYLELVCRMDVLDNLTQEIASESKNFLGQIITIQVESVNNYSNHKKLEFKGVVTSIDNSKGSNKLDGDLVIIKARSCDIIIDDGPHYASHSDVNLSSILQETLRGYDQSKLETVISPRYRESLHYSVQNGESAYQYISRLAAQYGEWFYYSGKKLIFGAPEQGDTITLNYGLDLHQFSIHLIPTSNNYKYFTNDYIADQQQEKATAQINSGANGYTNFTNQKSKELYSKETRVFTNIYNDSQLKHRLDIHVEQQKKAEEIKQVLLKGTSDNPAVQIGQIVRIEGDSAQCGSYRITKVEHTNTENGDYHNTFEGVTSELDAYPNTNMMAFPQSGSQVGVVTDTADPEGMSRIKVQFPWQKLDGQKTPWLRVLTPHAGGGKGLQFTPEKGEEVLVGFEGNNAERPYVMGALYTGTSNANDWKSDNNDIKAISSRSGHNITLNDKEGEESITITDKNGNSVTLNTSKSEITISAPKKITLSSEEIEINASKKVVVEGTNNVEIKSQEILADGTSKTTIKSTTQVNVMAANTNIKGDTKLKLESATTDIDGTMATNVKGGMLNLNCS
ncbi:type VI secretion system Vgr family protein [Aquimarina longa]|uniref:type VI secretion system Vgr family protein n=1 Tax=Aquimarina longa TaxID=1080221 RepID=UPI0007842767|nr:phage baseplate assembly protein V [Aquimarina longa]